MAAIPINGSCDARFAAVREEFEGNFASRGEVGAAVCVYQDGRKVVDLWGGQKDLERRGPWAEDTIVIINSVAKSMFALCTHILIDRGLRAPEAAGYRFAQREFVDLLRAGLTPARKTARHRRLAHAAATTGDAVLIARHELLDFGYLVVFDAQPEPQQCRGAERGIAVILFDGPEERHLARRHVCDEQAVVAFGLQRVPKAVPDAQLLAVLGESHVLRKWQLIRRVVDDRIEVAIDETFETPAIAITVAELRAAL